MRTAKRIIVMGGGPKILSAYDNKALAVQTANLAAYWPMSETDGTTCYDYSGAGRNLTYTGTTPSSGIGDGKGSQYFDAVNDYINVGTTMNGVFNGAEGTFAAWVKVYAASVWSDGTVRRVVYMRVDASNYFYILKDGSTSNRLAFRYVAGGTSELVNRDSSNATAWMHLAITWSKSGGTTGQFIPYYNGSAISTSESLGTWAGTNLSTSVIGAASATPADPWHGYLCKVGWWTKALTADEVATLAAV